MEAEINTRRLNVAQDYVDGAFCYGIRMGRDSFLIRSEGEAVSWAQVDQRGFEVSSAEVMRSRFSPAGVEAFLGGKTVDPFVLVDRIEVYLRRYIWLRDEDDYAMLAVWILGTYVFRVFRQYPYIHLSGDKGSGKTQLMEVLAPIAFNGELTTHPTAAVLYRDVQANCPTLFLDEMEKLRKQDRDAYAAILAVLKTGYRKSGLVKRCGGRNFDEIQTFETYGPKVLASISDLEDVLADRVIPVPMLKALPEELPCVYTDSVERKKIEQDLVDNLYIFGLRYGPTVATRYNEEQDKIEGLEGLNNRQRELWTPMMLLANLVDEFRTGSQASVAERLKRVAQRTKASRISDDREENQTAMLLTQIQSMFEEVPPFKEDGDLVIYSTEAVWKYLNRQENRIGFGTKSALTRYLSIHLDVGTKPVRIGVKSERCYVISRAKLGDRLRRYSISEESVTVTQSVTDDGWLT